MAVEKKSVVAIVSCDSYERDKVYDAVCRGIDLLGGVREIFAGKKKILLKPNILHGDPPERASATHPAIVYAMARFLQQNGFYVSCGDSPALENSVTALRRGGFSGVMEELGILPADFENGEERKAPAGEQNRTFFIARGVLEADAVVNLPKLKTHAMFCMTGAIKNLFGTIPGMRKAWFHARVPDPAAFARMLVDLSRLVSPALAVMDAVRGMEGNGPRNGTPVETNLLLFSTDPVAMDAVACRIMGISPGKNLLLETAHAAGLGELDPDRIEIRGKPFEECLEHRYVLHPADYKTFSASPWIRYIKSFIVPRPVVRKKSCNGCGMCVKICPAFPKALSLQKAAKPELDYRACIRCYCCQEVCPQGAISVKVPALGAILHGFRFRM